MPYYMKNNLKETNKHTLKKLKDKIDDSGALRGFH